MDLHIHIPHWLIVVAIVAACIPTAFFAVIGFLFVLANRKSRSSCWWV